MKPMIFSLLIASIAVLATKIQPAAALSFAKTKVPISLCNNKLALGPDEENLREAAITRRGLFRFLASAAAYATLGATAAFADDDVEAKSAFIAASNKFVRDSDTNNPLDAIDWDKQKKRGLNMEQMADAINDGLVEREWFVTGKGLPEYYSGNFAFTDPQVSLVGFEEYCRGVRRLFDQDSARCELVCCSATAPNTITVLWRNSGKVNIGSVQIDLKPYLVTTTLKTDPDDGNLIVSQVDEFESDSLGLVLYQVPLLRGLAGRPAPSVDVLKQQCDFRTCKLKK